MDFILHIYRVKVLNVGVLKEVRTSLFIYALKGVLFCLLALYRYTLHSVCYTPIPIYILVLIIIFYDPSSLCTPL